MIYDLIDQIDSSNFFVKKKKMKITHSDCSDLITSDLRFTIYILNVLVIYELIQLIQNDLLQFHNKNWMDSM